MKCINKQNKQECRCHTGDFTLDPELQDYINKLSSLTPGDFCQLIKAVKREADDEDNRTASDVLQIETAREAIMDLHEMVDDYYDVLEESLKIKCGYEDWVFDYINNTIGEVSFEEYLSAYNLLVEDVLE